MKFIEVKASYLKKSDNLEVELFVEVSKKKVLKLLNPTIIEDEDISQITKYSKQTFFVKSEDYPKFFQNILANNKKEGRDPGLCIEFTREVVGDAFNSGEGLEGEQRVEAILESSKSIVESILMSNNSLTSKSLLDLLKKYESNSDPYRAHGRQISIISLMISQLLPSIDTENINEIGYAASIHGGALDYFATGDLNKLDNEFFTKEEIQVFSQNSSKIAAKVAEKHIKGIDSLSESEELTYLQHLKFVSEKLDLKKIKFLKGLKRTLSDFKILQSKKDGDSIIDEQGAYISAKVLVIGDHFLDYVKKLKPNEKINSAILDMKKVSRDKKNHVYFDMKILEELETAILSKKF